MIRRSSPLRRTRVRAANPKRRARSFVRAYGSIERVEWIRSLPSVIDGARPCVNAHITSGGAGRKADADQIVPLTARQHDELHRIGLVSFQAKYAVDLAALAAETQRAWSVTPSPETPEPQAQDEGWTKNGQRQEQAARDASVCACGHAVNQHGATGLCLFGYNAAVVQYRQYDYDRRGERKCACNAYRRAGEEAR